MPKLLRCLVALVLLLPCALAHGAALPLTSSFSLRTQDGVVVRGDGAHVDFDWLQAVNENCVGWLYQEETLFSQPLLHCPSPGFYEKRGFDGFAVSTRGMAHIAVNAHTALDEQILYIYGSGREGGALESLNDYIRQSYLNRHPTLRLLTPAGDYQLEVFACVKTVERDCANWLPGQKEESFSEWLDRLLARSEVVAPMDHCPAEGDRITILKLLNADTHRRLVFCTMRPIRYETSRTVDLNKAEFDRQPTTSGRVDLGALGSWMVYAQNDPLWSEMRYESIRTSLFRRFRGGGCGPTAVAMAVANLVDKEELPRLRDHSANGIGTLFCPCSVNRLYCNHLHAPYHLQTPDDYLRYLPVVMADFAAMNNRWGINSRPADSKGSNIRFVDALCEIFDLKQTAFGSLHSALAAMENKPVGSCVILCYALRQSPFVTTGSHYVVVIGQDGRYFYVLDPLFRDDYALADKRSIIDRILAPGVVRIRLENMPKADLSVACMIEKP